LKKEHPTESSQVLLIAGMHRSGTSALTKTLSILGADLPSNLMPPMKNNNEKGFWESRDLEKIHDSILQSAGSMWDDWSEFNPEWFETITATKYLKKLLKYLQKDFKKSPLFIIKDPRICRFLPLWIEASYQFNSRPFVLIPFRHPLEVATSLKKRDGMAISKGLLLWLRHIVDAVHYSQSTPRAFISYNSLLSDWDACITSITQQTGVKWPKKSALSQLQIEEFLDIRQKHQTLENDTSFTKEFPDYIEKTYCALQALEKDKNNKSAIDTIESIRTDFNKKSSIYAKISIFEQLELRKTKTLLCQLEKENFDLDKKLNSKSYFVNELQDAHATKDRFIEELQEGHATKDQQIAELQEAHATKDQQIAELKEAHATKDQLIAELKEAHATKDQQIADLQEAHATKDQQIAKLQKFEQNNTDLNTELKKIKRKLIKEKNDLELYYTNLLKDKDTRIQNAKEFIKILTDSKKQYKKYTRYLNQKTGNFLLPKYPSISSLKRGRTLEKDIQLIRESGKFDPLFYLINNPDVLHAGVSPLEHFCTYGWKEGRNPNSSFSFKNYCKKTPEALDTGINPFVHYLLWT